MSDENEITEEDRPQQTVRRMPEDQPEVGPYFPSGMSAPEAALSGATANLTEEQVAELQGEEVAGRERVEE
jgi:hypothetical protein